MKLKDISRRDIIKMALKALPESNEGHAIVVVDVRDGSVEVLTKTEEAAGLDFDTLYRKHKHEVCCRILEIKDRYPHLK